MTADQAPPPHDEGENDEDDDDMEPRGLDDDSGFGPDSYFSHAMSKDD